MCRVVLTCYLDGDFTYYAVELFDDDESICRNTFSDMSMACGYYKVMCVYLSDFCKEGGE